MQTEEGNGDTPVVYVASMPDPIQLSDSADFGAAARHEDILEEMPNISIDVVTEISTSILRWATT